MQISDKQKYTAVLLFALMLAVLNVIVMVPLGLGRAGGFFIYFFAGYCIKKTGWLSLPKATGRSICMAVMMFVASFLFSMAIEACMQVCDTLVEKIVRMILLNICHLANALSAIYLIYTFANRESVLRYLNKKPFLITCSGYCYGVYIYHQFILMYIYDYTRLPFVVGPYWLPWIATGITITLALILCHYSLKTRLGRFLIG